MIIYSLIFLKHIQLSHLVTTPLTFPQQPEKCKTSNNNSHPLPTKSDDPVPAYGIPPDAAVCVPPLQLPSPSLPAVPVS